MTRNINEIFKEIVNLKSKMERERVGEGGGGRERVHKFEVKIENTIAGYVVQTIFVNSTRVYIYNIIYINVFE